MLPRKNRKTQYDLDRAIYKQPNVEDVGFWRLLKVGAVAMPLALIAALGARIALG